MAQTQRIETGLPQVSAADLAQMERTLALLKQAGAPDAAAGGGAAENVTAPVTSRRRRATQEPTMNVPTASGSTSSKSNMPTLESVIEKVKEIGETQGKAADGLTRFLITTADAAFTGVIDRQKDKHGPGVKDNNCICEAYVKARTGATMFDTKPVKARKFLSITDTMIRLGMYSKGGPGEPLSTLNAVVNLHQKLRKDPTKAGDLVDLPGAIIKFAREQVKRDTMLTESEYRTFLVKKAKDPRTVEEWWDHVRRQALKLKAGQLKSIAGEDMSDEMDKVITAANKRLRDIAKGKGVQPADHKTAAAEQAA